MSSAAGQLILTPGVSDPVDTAEKARLNLGLGADRVRRSALGQFFSPAATARLMASMSSLSRDRVCSTRCRCWGGRIDRSLGD